MKLGRAPRPAHWSALATAVVVLAAAAACGGGDGGPELSEQAREGRRLYNSSGCAGCHGREADGGVGPSLVGIAGTERTLVDGTTVIADDAYLTRALTDPDAEIVAGYSLRMPGNRLNATEVAAIVAYMKELEAAP